MAIRSTIPTSKTPEPVNLAALTIGTIFLSFFLKVSDADGIVNELFYYRHSCRRTVTTSSPPSPSSATKGGTTPTCSEVPKKECRKNINNLRTRSDKNAISEELKIAINIIYLKQIIQISKNNNKYVRNIKSISCILVHKSMSHKVGLSIPSLPTKQGSSITRLVSSSSSSMISRQVAEIAPHNVRGHKCRRVQPKLQLRLVPKLVMEYNAVRTPLLCRLNIPPPPYADRPKYLKDKGKRMIRNMVIYSKPIKCETLTYFMPKVGSLELGTSYGSPAKFGHRSNIDNG